MLPKMARFLGPPSRMDIQIQLDKKDPVYTNDDQVSGRVILYNEAEVDIATITIRLSGAATSRLRSEKLTESHEVCSATCPSNLGCLILWDKAFQQD